MLFSEEKRGGDWVELQYCFLPEHTPLHKRLSLNRLVFGQIGSLYAEGFSFCNAYAACLGDGVYANLKSGPLDLCGVNYYPPTAVAPIVERILAEKPPEYETVVRWLEKAARGFYVMGI